MKRLPLITSFILFIALCVSTAYWAMQIFKPPVRAVAAPPQAERPPPPISAAAGLLGGRAAIAVASNYQLKGVVVAAKPAESVAILAVNGKPAQAIRANREVVPGVRLTEVQRDHVLLSENGIIKQVDLPIDAKRASVTATSIRMVTPAVPSPTTSPQINNQGQATPSGGQQPMSSDETARLKAEYKSNANKIAAEVANIKDEYLSKINKNPSDAARLKAEYQRKIKENSADEARMKQEYERKLN